MKLFLNKINVKLNERAIVLTDGRPTRFLEPGVHRVWAPFEEIDVRTYDVRKVLVTLTAEERAVTPEGVLRTVELREDQRAVVRVRGVPFRWLGPGVHTLWNTERMERVGQGVATSIPAIEVETFDTSAVAAPPLAAALRVIAPSVEYSETVVPHGSVALRFVDGVLDKVLGPGRYAAWTTQREVVFRQIDLREKELAVSAQEVMTRDRVSIRINVSVVYQVADVEQVATVSQSPDQTLYLEAQLAVRKAIATRTLDELLADREALAEALVPELNARAEELGLVVRAVGVKDFILPGAMKELLNKVIEARKRAEANVILRREEIAATKSMAQTANVLEENPVLLRLKELEAYKELAEKVGHIEVYVGKDDVLRLVQE